MANSPMSVDRFMAHYAEHCALWQRRLQKGSHNFLGSLDTAIGTTPYDIVFSEDRVRLKHYHPLTSPRIRTPLLVTYALINRETMLDLQPGRSVVRTLLENGIDVYMIDWGYPTRKDRYLTIDDHVNGYMDSMVEFVRRRTGADRINMMGICMGGTFSVMYAALHPHNVKNLVTTVSPTSFDTDQGLLHTWMRNMDVDKMVDAFGNIPGDLLNFGFLMLNPPRLMLDKYVGLLESVEDKAFIENFVRMEKWIFDSPDVPGETFRQFMKDCYQKNLLIQNNMTLRHRRVDLRSITMPLLNFYGRYDHLVPPAACDRLVQVVSSRDAHNVCLDTGHIGIYVSSKCQNAFAPRIVQWLAERDGPAKRKAKNKQRPPIFPQSSQNPLQKPANPVGVGGAEYQIRPPDVQHASNQ